MPQVPGESIGTARIDIIADTAAFEAQVARAKSQIATLGPAGEASFAKMTAAQKRATLSALQFEQSIGKSRDEMRLLSLAARGAAPDALERLRQKMLDVKAASAGAALDAARFSDAQIYSANKALTAFRAEAAAKAATAETDAQATARIRDMVQASLAAEQAERARAEAQRVTSDQAVKSSAAQIAASRSLVKAQTEQMAAYTAMRAPVMEVEAILQKRVLTTEEVARVESLLDKAQATGAITTGELSAAFAALDRAKIKDIAVTEAQTAATKQAVLSSRAYSEIATGLSEVLAGNPGRLRRTGAAFLNQSGLLSKLFTPAGLGITTAVAAIAAFTVAIGKGEEETFKFNQALVGTGTASTATAGQLVDMADRIGVATGRYGDAVAALTQLAATGKYSRSQLESLSRTALDFATATGGKLADGIRFVDGVMGGNLDTLIKLDQQYHFLTATQLEHIRQLDEEGQSERANAIAQQAASDAVHRRAQEVKDSAGIMVRGWESVKEAASAAWSAMKDVGATHSVSQQLKDATAALQQARGTHPNRAGEMVQNASPDQIAALRAQVNGLRAQVVAQGFAQTAAAINQNAETKSKAALGYLDQFKTPLEVFKDATAKAKKELDDAMLGHLTADEIARAKMHYEQALAAAQKTFDSATRQPGAAHGKAGKPFDNDAYQKKAVEEIQKQIQAEGVLMDQRQRAADSVKAYQNSLDDMLKTRQAQIDLQVQSVGMGQLEVQQRNQLIAIDEDYNRKADSLRRQQQNSTSAIDKAAYQQQLDDLKAYHDKRIQMEITGFAAEQAARGNWVNGARAALADFSDQAADVAGQTRDVFMTAFGDLTDALTNFVMTGKISFKSLVDDVLKGIVQMEMRAAEAKIFQLIAGMFSGVSDNGSAAYASYDTSGGAAIGAGYVGQAMGGVWSGPSIAALSGSVLTRPTYIPMARGGVLAGEAGDEAIMPLSRGPNGKLGVKATGGQQIELHINLKNESGQALQAKQQGQASMDGNKIMADFVLTTVATDVVKGGSTAKAMQQRFGLARAGVPVGA